MNINTRTTFQNIIKDMDSIEITAPSFRFINAGNVTVFINNVPLMPGASLGDDSSGFWASLLATNPGATMKRTDSYTITFKLGLGTAPVVNDSDPGYPKYLANEIRRSCYLVQTFYSIEK